MYSNTNETICTVCGKKFTSGLSFESHIINDHNMTMLSYEITYGKKINEATKNNQRIVLVDSGRGNTDIGNVI